MLWLDPLDGTSEYTGGNLSAVTCLMGIAVDGVPFAGVIHQVREERLLGACIVSWTLPTCTQAESISMEGEEAEGEAIW